MSEAEVPVSTVPIPDEAWQAIYDQNVWDIASALEIAAPFIARAAQVQVLREMAEKVDHMQDHAAGEISASAFGEVWVLLTDRADELEGRR